MDAGISRAEAAELLKKYNKEPFHILHGLTVEGVMRWYATVSYTHLVKETGTSQYYMFNTSTPEGFETCRAVMAFLAERYNGSDPNYGQVSNWIIGNEINNQEIWNYTGPMPLEQYVACLLYTSRCV